MSFYKENGTVVLTEFEKVLSWEQVAARLRQGRTNGRGISAEVSEEDQRIFPEEKRKSGEPRKSVEPQVEDSSLEKTPLENGTQQAGLDGNEIVYEELRQGEEAFFQRLHPLALFREEMMEHEGERKKVLFALTTLGKEMDEYLCELFSEGEYTKALVMDAAATVYLFSMQKMMEHELYQHCMEKNYGICGQLRVSQQISLEFQKEIVDKLGAGEYGITVNSSYMLSPEKSVSLIYLIGEKGKFTPEHGCSGCGRCAMKLA